MPKFYKTIVTVTVLSCDEQVDPESSLEDINYLISEGGCSGAMEVGDPLELTPEEMAEELVKQDSDPQYFGIECEK